MEMGLKCRAAIFMLILSQCRIHSRPTSILYPELLGRRPPEAEEVISKPGCLRHDDCSDDQFCRWTWCDSGEEWWYICGICKPCAECARNGDGIDLSCGAQCPDQPSSELRFLQGEFYSSWDLQGTQLSCLYHIVFMGDTLTESRMIVPRDHPAGAPVAGQYYQEVGCGLCQPFIASGIFRVAKSSPPMLLKVTYTSLSTQASLQWGCSSASSSSPEPWFEAHEITIDLIAAQRLSLVTRPRFAKVLYIVSQSFTYSIF